MKEYNKSEFLIETIVPQDELIVSRTDLKGVITYANDTFAQISGYEVKELIGKAHNIVRHPDMPKEIFSQMWKSLQQYGKWQGIVKNIRKDSGYYWVHATISEVYKDGKLIEFKSIRTPITYEQKIQAQRKYDELRNINNDNIRSIIYN